MEFPDNIEALGKASQTFLMMHGGSLPEHLRDHLLSALGAPSPVDRIVKAGEALYANAADLDNDGKTLCAQLISFASLNGWHGLADDNRGGRIVMAMRRELGEKAPSGKWPVAADDPEALSQYAAPSDEVTHEPQPQGGE